MYEILVNNIEILISLVLIVISLFGGSQYAKLKLLPILKITDDINHLLIDMIEEHNPQKNATIKLNIKAEAVILGLQDELHKKIKKEK